MDEPIDTIRALIDRIASAPLDGNSVESRAHDHLVRLLADIERGNRSDAKRCTARLHEFWLQSVPWCSPLSKELEKLLIQLEEQQEAGQW